MRRPWWISAGIAYGIVIAVTGPKATAATELAWSGEYRLRAESIERSLQGRRVHWDFLQRVRFGVTARVHPEVSAFLQIQDSRLWGSEGGTLGDLHNLDLHQGFVEVVPAAATGLRLRIGRQELAYGEDRIIGSGNFNNIGRAFDGLQARWQRGRFTADVVGARVAETVMNPSGNDDIFLNYDRWASDGGREIVETYVMHRASPGAKFETTLGERVVWSRAALRLEEELAFQLGRRSGNDVRAFLLATSLKWQAHARAAAGAGFDMLSGDDPDTVDDEFLDPARLFQTGHRYYGRLDVAEGLAGRAGLLDPYATLQVQAPGAVYVRLDAHLLRVHRDTGAASELGSEVDLILQRQWQAVRFEALGAVLVPSRRLEETGRDRAAWFGFVSSQVNF
jgi:hypothetical protein